MSLLEVKDVNQYYGGSHILRNVNLTAELGQVTVVLGRNGVGKTTLLKSLMGLVPIKSGSITLDGVAIDKATPYERARMGVGFVPQGREIFGRLTVQENLQMGLAYKSGGTPIPAEMRAKLFEPFQRGTAPRFDAIQGSGLGLSIVADCARLLGGLAEIVDVNYADVCIRIRLPMVEDPL